MPKFIELQIAGTVLSIYLRPTEIDTVEELETTEAMIETKRGRVYTIAQSAREVIDMIALEECAVNNAWPERGA